ncbi:MAG: hypothetical protein V4727_10475 [Verrucomicrobiota bacterium]
MKIAFPDDFSDRLSPMLVKELRQGLRTRAFIGVFLTLQIVLGIILLGAGTASSSDQAGSTISNIIFIFFAIAVIILQPMRGMGALSSEIKGNTIDMMVLTRLSAWRIVAGKWSAIVSQSALILITIIPYLILRYFFGGMNLVGEVVMLLLIFITSATLTAITVGLSASTSVILRSILPLIGIPMLAIGLFGMIVDNMMYGRGSSFDFFSLETTESRVAIALYITTCLYYSFFLLSIGTSLIAPYAENYSTARRVISLIVTVAAAVIGMIYIDDIEVMIAVYFMIFAPIFTISLTEFGILVPPVVSKFSRYGAIGKLLGIFLLPTWATGVFFCYLLALIAAVSLFFIHDTYINSDAIVVGMGIISSMMFPAILVNFFKMHGPARVSNYILMCVACGVISLTLLGIAESLSSKGFLWLFVWIPPVSMAMSEVGGIDDDAVMIATALFNLVYFVIFTSMAARHYTRSINELNHSGS